MCAAPVRPPSLSGFASYLTAQVAKGAARVIGEQLAPLGLRPHHLAVLSALGDLGPQCQQDLCDRLDLDKSHMVGFVDDLEALGHLHRTRDPEDRRRHRVEITVSGRQLLTRLLAIDRGCHDEVFAVLADDEREVLVGLLRRVVEDLDTSRLGTDHVDATAAAAEVTA